MEFKHAGGDEQAAMAHAAAGSLPGGDGLTMDGSRSPLVEMRARVSKTPLALEPYVAFEALVKDKLATWPKLSAERAAGFIISVWATRAASTGQIRLSKQDLNWIVSTGKQCARGLKGAETVWAKELASHLLRITSKT